MKKILVLCMLLLLSSCSWNSDNEIFKKKQECLKYKDNIEKEIKEDLWVLSELFYSPSKNTCVYIYNQNIAWESHQFIINYLTKETIFYCDWKIRTIDTCNEKVKELKWE